MNFVKKITESTKKGSHIYYAQLPSAD